MSLTVKEVGKAGRGLVASKDIKNGELIVKYSAVIAIPDVGEAGEEIVRQLKQRNSKEKEDFYNLTIKEDKNQFCNDLRKEVIEDTKTISKDQKIEKFKKEISITIIEQQMIASEVCSYIWKF